MAANGHAVLEPKERHPWRLGICGCGCGRSAPYNRLRLVRLPGTKAHFVHAECEDAFTIELSNRQKLREVVDVARSLTFHRRWKYARIMFALTYVISSRIHGEHRARALARRQTTLFCLPHWISRRVIPWWKP